MIRESDFEQRLGGGEGGSPEHMWVQGVAGRGDSRWTGHEATRCLRPGTARGWAHSRLSLPGAPRIALYGLVSVHFRIC